MSNPDVLRLLAAQHGVVSLDQLAALGVSRSAMWRSQRRGAFVLVLPGVLRALSHTETFEALAMAVQLHTAPHGVLSSTTAGRILGLRDMPTRPIRVVESRRVRSKLPSWVRRTTASWLDPEVDVTTVRGFRLLRPVSTLITLAELFNDFRFERAAEDFWHLKLVTPTEAAAFLESHRRSGRGGVARFERWLNKTAARHRPSQSGFELDILGAIRRVGLPEPCRQFPLTLASGETIHLDFAWPAVKLAVEPGHSWWHGGDLRVRSDMARDRACGMLGWFIARYDESARADLTAVGGELRRLYGERRPLVDPR